MGPSIGLTSRSAKTINTEYQGANWPNEGAGAPRATVSGAAIIKTASGTPMATTYQYHETRQRMRRDPSWRRPAMP